MDVHWHWKVSATRNEHKGDDGVNRTLPELEMKHSLGHGASWRRCRLRRRTCSKVSRINCAIQMQRQRPSHQAWNRLNDKVMRGLGRGGSHFMARHPSCTGSIQKQVRKDLKGQGQGRGVSVEGKGGCVSVCAPHPQLSGCKLPPCLLIL